MGRKLAVKKAVSRNPKEEPPEKEKNEEGVMS
jgi:hypothetical protein